MNDRDVFVRFGYDPDDPVPRDDDGQRIIPDRLFTNLRKAPLVDERSLGGVAPSWKRRRSNEQPLTVAETEILHLLSIGYVPKTIAVLRFTSLHTVRSQIETARRTMGARNTTQAVAEAIRRGLI